MPTVLYLPSSSGHSTSLPTDLLTQVRFADTGVAEAGSAVFGSAVALAAGADGDGTGNGDAACMEGLGRPPLHAVMTPMLTASSIRFKRPDVRTNGLASTPGLMAVGEV